MRKSTAARPSPRAPRGSRIGNRSPKPATPRTNKCRLHYIAEFPEGLTARDFKKIKSVFDFMAYALRGIDELPGVTAQFPVPKGRGMNPARVFVENFLHAGKTYCEDRATPKQLLLKLETEGNGHV